MMKCAEALEWMPVYSQLPEDDPQRLAIEKHVSECESCAEQYSVWAASEEWMEDDSDILVREASGSGFSPARVMNMIYEEQDWLVPVHQRSQTWSLRSRNMLAGIVAFCMGIFLCALIVLLVRREQSNIEDISGVIPTVVAGGDQSGWGNMTIGVPVASISDPVILQVVPTIPHYWIALSLFGVTFALLLLNWLTRVRR
ncbi:zf-HC2 domain-containing protein [Paenibacillus thiaminolyticus]|uniref:Zf-HC2 domain-containing protein n=1 Tax=Paenibacillus thiaminolyticus TaxID=49283 RepID=A0AAJ1G9H4_PANTH|nr:zf-HC2 domain-containing protein [Paenibacillus thiaminolyticus]MCY9537901.1 zf-HC2 domain-containing protein [Paenibacillus thiaminolyticus]MCY9602658.1 zf-HC2 domain-containing protein [Paenibacillus thiaminolyticus]MCY9611051.1 zf-HC2 domain-containing protein [Paenibacillus thiaminolyticus]MCY9616755.1 zf-HC2 domain-containing protein [Paenibacillus thiaminolyticus]MCY9619455.1 zf-HC2 domain-containing protein [Paenibacillus thiaminolyticus]